jgi:hypothetical protein
LQFKFHLAELLGMTVKQLCETMDCVEFHQWSIHLQQKAAQEQAAIERAKRKRL